MKKISVYIVKHLIIWLGLSTLFFFFSEKITKWIAPGFDNVKLWLIVVMSGLALILLITAICFIAGLRKLKKN